MTTMTPDRFDELIEHFFDGSRTDCAKFLGYSRAAVHKMIKGGKILPATAMLLELMLKHSIDPNEAMAVRHVRGNQFEQLLTNLNLSQRACSFFLGTGTRTIREWIAGDRKVDYAAAMLLGIMIMNNISTAEALSAIGVDVQAAKRAADERGHGAIPRYFANQLIAFPRQ
jgi:DNA-binding transcriptional regulator YiaG